MSICVIPARGGSQRIPKKNIRWFCGRPMISWSIAAARAANVFDRIVVSTDDAEVADVARAEGADVPFERPAAISGDHVATGPVVAHAVEALALAADVPVCCLYATAPLVQAADLAAGLPLLKSNVTYVVAVTTFPYPIQRALRRHANGGISMMALNNMSTRSQDLEEAWHDAGQFYWARAETWTAGTPVFATGAYGLPLPRHRVQDIDTLEDWQHAEKLFAALPR